MKWRDLIGQIFFAVLAVTYGTVQCQAISKLKRYLFSVIFCVMVFSNAFFVQKGLLN